MGIVNVTPDSFSDGGEFFSLENAVKHGRKLAEQGAAILDIGGESTRPNATPVSFEDEIKRIIPVIDGLKNAAPFISADTRNTQTMSAAISAGANFINDVNALRDFGAIELLSNHSHVCVCLMHMDKNPKTMQHNPTYKNVVAEVLEFLRGRIEECVKGGIDKARIVADVGIGFGKTPQHNIELLQGIGKIKSLGVPVLIGTSRKSFISSLSNNEDTDNRIGGTIASNLYAASMGADILRVHDVLEISQALTIQKALR